MEKIPIEFDYKGKHYAGHFQQIHGAAAPVFFLYIDNFYYGRLRSYNQSWVFDPSKFGMEDLASFFGEHVSKFMQKH
jgi:hypothetical protein